MRMWEECSRANREYIKMIKALEEENRRLKLLIRRVLEKYPWIRSYFRDVDLGGVEERSVSYREVSRRLRSVESLVLSSIQELFEIRGTPLTYSDIIGYLVKKWARARRISETLAYAQLSKMDVKRLIRKLAQEGKITRVEDGLFAPIRYDSDRLPRWLEKLV